MVEPRRLNQLFEQVSSAADLPSGDLAVALSGGADSAALLYICVRLGRTVRAVHVHHGWPASDLLADAARETAERLGVSIEMATVETPPGASREAQARVVRYAALERAARPGEWMLTAHTADDQAETVIDHLLRASGSDGLRGIPRRRRPFARPILSVGRAETRELATLAGLPWRDDPSNLWDEFLRVRIRQDLLPRLERYNPRIRESLGVTAALLTAEVEHLDHEARCPIQVGEREVGIASSLLTMASPAVARRRARRLLSAAGLLHPGLDMVENVLAVAKRESTGYVPSTGFEVRRRGAMVVIELPHPDELLDPVPLDHGETRFGDWVFRSWVQDSPPAAMPLGAWWMVADAEVVERPVIISAENSEAAMDVLRRSGVPSSRRGGHPVLVSGDRPIWVPGVKRLPFGWVDSSTGHYLVVLSEAVRTWLT